MRRIFLTLIIGLLSNVYAGPTKVGNGDDGADLEGFSIVHDGLLLETKNEAIVLLKKLNTFGIIGLGNLIPEVENSNIYSTNKDVDSKKLEELGAFHSGMEGLVYARTFSRPYAPTRFFPASLKLSKKQLISLHIHEALHRSLPQSAREDEKIVTKITLAITSPEQTSDSIQSTIKETIPELFSAPSTVKPINKNSKLINPSSLEISAGVWTQTKRSNSSANSITLPMTRTYELVAQFFPFGGTQSATGFEIKTLYIFTKSNNNYFGPLELTARHLLWTERGYDFEFKLGGQIMSASNSKVINSVSGRDQLIFGAYSNKVTDIYKLKMGVDFLSGSKIKRTLNGFQTDYDIGSIINISGAVIIPWKEFNFGAEANIISLSSLDVVQNSNHLLTKERDQYFSAGPILKYNLNKDVVFNLTGIYLFNSNKNINEDHLRDVFGLGLGQWKIKIGTAFQFD